jgi:DNA-binding transcriptional regulator YiaG
MNSPISFAHVDLPDREPYHYKACGLENVYLISGYQERVIGGETYVSIKDVQELHEAIAVALVHHRKLLSGPEVRFIRKYLDLTQRGLAELLAVSDQMVARYEKGQTDLVGPADGILRLLVAEHSGGKVRIRQELERIRSVDDTLDANLTFELTDDEWRSAA